MSETAYRLGAKFAEIVLQQCNEAGMMTGESSADIAKHVMVNLMIQLNVHKQEDNALLMVRKNGETWDVHLHFDYLSADHDHFKKDFDWGVSAHKSEDQTP